jgi:benzoylsuccinyl-CoA thiolase BbsB subunit
MRSVYVLGASMIPFGKYPDRALDNLGRPAAIGAIRDAGIPKSDIDAAYCGTAMGGMLAGQRILRNIGMTGIPISNVENACSSSAAAFHTAWMAVSGGHHDVALVLGVEKLTKFGGGTLPLEDEDWEVGQGMTMPALYAMRARRYMYERDLTRQQLAEIAVKAKSNGALNPYAQLRKPITVDQVLESRMIADPLRLFDCCPTGDGAAALVICDESTATRLGRRQIRVLASTLSSGHYEAGYRDMTVAEISARTARAAYEMAGIGPEDVDVAEVHDAFSIAEVMYYEALGFCDPGDAPKLIDEKATHLGGRLPVNPSGGLLARGHPVGATGAAQLVEMTWQLRGETGDRQVAGAQIGLTHVTGGGISGLDHGACTINILAKVA